MSQSLLPMLIIPLDHTPPTKVASAPRRLVRPDIAPGSSRSTLPTPSGATLLDTAPDRAKPLLRRCPDRPSRPRADPNRKSQYHHASGAEVCPYPSNSARFVSGSGLTIVRDNTTLRKVHQLM